MISHLPLNLWVDLIFVRFDLEDLSRIRRVCRAFSTHELLKQRFDIKLQAAFGDITPLHWNRFYGVTVVTLEVPTVAAKYANRIVGIQYAYMWLSDCFRVCRMCVFSSKRRALQSFTSHFSGLRTGVPYVEYNIHGEGTVNVFVGDQNGGCVYVGITQEIRDYFASKAVKFEKQ